MTALTHEGSLRLEPDAATVFAALTSEVALRGWFAEHVELEPAVGQPFRFWGRYTYGTATRAQATQRITAFDALHRTMAFSWEVDGVPSTVRLSVASADKGSTLTVRHAFDALPQVERFPQLVDDLWRLHMGNLATYLRTGAAAFRPDFGDAHPVIRLSILIDAPRERIYNALLDPAFLNRWGANGAVVEPRVGGRYSYGWKYKHGGRDVLGGPTQVLELVPNEKLVTDWPDWRGEPDGPTTTLAWLLSSEGQQTRLTLVQEGFSRAADVSDYPFGWSHFLSAMKQLIEAEA